MRKTYTIVGLDHLDSITLAEVWAEFRWHIARKGIKRLDDLSDKDYAWYRALVAERARRGEQLTLFNEGAQYQPPPRGDWEKITRRPRGIRRR